MLIVLVIVGVLTALIFGGVSSFLNRAHSATAAHNLRTMGGALMAYASENDGRLVSGSLGPLLKSGELASGGGSAVAFWFNALDYYLGGTDHTLEGMRRLDRPEWQQDPLKRYTTPVASPTGYGISVGYGWNHMHFGLDRKNEPPRGWSTALHSVEQPAKTIIIGTGEDSLNENNTLRNIMIYANSIRSRRHDGGGYYLFLDGHTEHLTPEEVMEDNSFLMRRVK